MAKPIVALFSPRDVSKSLDIIEGYMQGLREGKMGEDYHILLFPTMQEE